MIGERHVRNLFTEPRLRTDVHVRSFNVSLSVVFNPVVGYDIQCEASHLVYIVGF